MNTTTHPVNVSSKSFDAEVMKSPIPVVVDLWAPWCGPCRMVAPVLERLAGEYAGRVKVAKINVDEEQELADAFRVRGIPTLVVVKDGAAVGQMVGFAGAKALDELFAKLAETPAESPAETPAHN